MIAISGRVERELALDFVRLADLLRCDGAEPYKELVDTVRTRFPGRGHAYDDFIDQLRPLASGFLSIPQSSDGGRSARIRYWLNEAAQGRGQNFKPVLLRWFWKHDETWTREFLLRWQNTLCWSDQQFSLPKAEYKAIWPQRDQKVTLVYFEHADIRPLNEIAHRLKSKIIATELFELPSDVTETVNYLNQSEEIGITVFYSTPIVFDSKFDLERAWAKHSADHDKFDALTSSISNLLILNQERQKRHKTRSDGRAIAYLELPSGVEPVASALETAALKFESSSQAFARYCQALCDKNAGQKFLENVLEQRAESYPDGISISLFDIDMTNQINRKFGDDIGDAVIAETLNIIQNGLAKYPSDCGRCGDDTFYAAIYDGFNREADMRRLNQAIASYSWTALMPHLRVTCSAGYAGRKPNEAVTDIVLKAALGLEAARKNGGNQLKAGPSRIPNATSRYIRHHFS